MVDAIGIVTTKTTQVFSQDIVTVRDQVLAVDSLW